MPHIQGMEEQKQKENLGGRDGDSGLLESKTYPNAGCSEVLMLGRQSLHAGLGFFLSHCSEEGIEEAVIQSG